MLPAAPSELTHIPAHVPGQVAIAWLHTSPLHVSPWWAGDGARLIWKKVCIQFNENTTVTLRAGCGRKMLLRVLVMLFHLSCVSI